MSIWCQNDLNGFKTSTDGQISEKTEAGKFIIDLIQKNNLKNILEIGTWNGLGSTKCILKGLKDKPYEKFISIECNREKLEKAKDNLKDYLSERDFLMWGSIVSIETITNEESIFPEILSNPEFKRWHEIDIDNIKQSPILEEIKKNKFDFVLFDGGEFTTYYEFQEIFKLCDDYILLDDVNTNKCKKIREILLQNNNWNEIFYTDERNGFSVFEIQEKFMIKCVIKAFSNADLFISKINDDILNIDGMSGICTRHFYNNLLNMKNASYLEIGTWKGSTVCSAMFKNKAKIVCIDNWSEFGGPKDEFISNFLKYKGENDATFIEKDCLSVDIKLLPKFNIYLYDGEHTYDSQYKALTYFSDCLYDTFIFIVDDWNFKFVREGTLDAIRSLNLKILYKKEIFTTNTDSKWTACSKWHHGIFVAVLQK